MRRLIALVAKLYPRSWREQYDREFGALLDDLRPSARMFGNVLGGAVRMQISEGRNWLRLAIAMSAMGAIVAGGASFTAQKHYMASTSIAVTPQPDPLRPISPEALRLRAQQRFADIRDGLLSRQSLAAIINDPALNLYKVERTRMPLETVEDQMRRDIRIQPNPAGNDPRSAIVYYMAFTYPDRAKAQATVRELANKLVRENDAENRERMETYQDFWSLEAWAHRAKPAPPPPVGDSVAILAPPPLPNSALPRNRMALLAVGAGAGLMLGLLAAAAWQWKRRFWRLAGFAAAGLVLAAAASFLIPNRYTASAVMTLSPATLTTDPLQPLPPATPADVFLHRIEPRVLSTKRLSNMIQDPHLNLYTEELRSKPMEEVIRNMVAHDIRIEPIGSGSSAFRISFSYPDRKKAQDGANTLITLFIDENWQFARANAAGNVLVQSIAERRAGEYLALLDAPTIPWKPESPNRPAISLFGMVLGLSIGAFAPRRQTA